MFDPKMTLEELKENIEFLESAGLAHTTSKVTGELRIQAGSAFVKMLNCSEDNLDLNSLSYPHSFLNKDVSDIHKEFTEWESQTKHVVYYLQGITRGNAPSEERSRAEQLLIKLRKLNLDFLKAYVKMKASTSKIDDVRKPLIIQRNDILSEILSLITNKKLPIVDDFIGNELVRLIIREEKCSAGTDQISSFGKLAEAILIMP